jgi:hypothetical protein
MPDLMIVNPNHDHNGLALEFKHPGFESSPTAEQLNFHIRLRALGWKIVLCNDCTELSSSREIDAYMKTCKIICECCVRLFPSKRHIDAHILRVFEDKAHQAALKDSTPGKETKDKGPGWKKMKTNHNIGKQEELQADPIRPNP